MAESAPPPARSRIFWMWNWWTISWVETSMNRE